MATSISKGLADNTVISKVTVVVEATVVAKVTLHAPHSLTTSLPHSSSLTPPSSPVTPHSSPLTLLTFHPSFRTPHPSLLTPHSSPLTPHPSPLTPHPSPLTLYPSPLTPHSSLLSVSQVNGELWDLDRPLVADCSLQLLKFEDEEGMHMYVQGFIQWGSCPPRLCERLCIVLCERLCIVYSGTSE